MSTSVGLPAPAGGQLDVTFEVPDDLLSFGVELETLTPLPRTRHSSTPGWPTVRLPSYAGRRWPSSTPPGGI